MDRTQGMNNLTIFAALFPHVFNNFFILIVLLQFIMRDNLHNRQDIWTFHKYFLFCWFLWVRKCQWWLYCRNTPERDKLLLLAPPSGAWHPCLKECLASCQHPFLKVVQELPSPLNQDSLHLLHLLKEQISACPNPTIHQVNKRRLKTMSILKTSNNCLSH